MAYPTVSKFQIDYKGQNKNTQIKKIIDEKVFFEMFPEQIDYKTLDAARRQIATHSQKNLIGPGGTLMDIFRDQARVVDTPADYLRWKLYTLDGDIRATFSKFYLTEEQLECVGGDGAIFEIGLDCETFGPNDVIAFEDLMECPILIRSEGEPDGQVWRYEAVAWDDAGFPAEELEAGARIVQIGSLIGEATRERGNIRFNMDEAYVEFEVATTRMGWSLKVTDNAWLAADSYKMSPCDEKGKINGKGFIYNTLEEKFMAEVRRQKDLWLVWGRSANRFAGKFLDGLTQRPIQAGPGLYEFLEGACKLDYNPEDNIISILKDFLPGLWDDKVPYDKRVVDLWTGSGGLEVWERSARQLDMMSGVMQTETLNYTRENAISKGTKAIGINARRITKYFIHPFGELRVKHLPMLDSALMDSRRYKGHPLRSYEFLIFNYGYGTAKNGNIYIAEDSRKRNHLYGIGTWTPLGPAGQQRGKRNWTNTLGSENAYEMIHECSMGFVMKDTSAMIWVRPCIR